jgi:hypothetical protein
MSPDLEVSRVRSALNSARNGRTSMGDSSSNGSAFILLTTPRSTQLSDQDLSFLQQAQVSNLTEIAGGKLALAKAPDLATEEFGRWMITDHRAPAG